MSRALKRAYRGMPWTLIAALVACHSSESALLRDASIDAKPIDASRCMGVEPRTASALGALDVQDRNEQHDCGGLELFGERRRIEKSGVRNHRIVFDVRVAIPFRDDLARSIDTHRAARRRLFRKRRTYRIDLRRQHRTRIDLSWCNDDLRSRGHGVLRRPGTRESEPRRQARLSASHRRSRTAATDRRCRGYFVTRTNAPEDSTRTALPNVAPSVSTLATPGEARDASMRDDVFAMVDTSIITGSDHFMRAWSS